ncbi:MAG: FAD-binding domain-containing protein [Microcoleaceae cyanobacterium]
MSDLILFWHRRDLRVSDNVGLAAACERSSKVVGIFCLDPHILKSDDVSPARVTYMIGCLAHLQDQYRVLGSQMLIVQDAPQTTLPKLATALNATAVYWNLDVEPYAQERDRTVSQALKTTGISVEMFWDQLLHPPGKVLTQSGEPYRVYTPFWRNWSNQTKADPAEPYTGKLTGLTEIEQEIANSHGAIALPTAQNLGFNWKNDLFLEPGEAVAQQKLAAFCRDALEEYDEQRNFPNVSGTSQLSAAFKFGVISIRTVWAKTVAALQQSRSDEARKNINTWQQELAWREFYQQALYYFPELAQGAYREPFKTFPWENNEQHFQAWCEGRTGYPIVDAAMRQLNETGWMHNRCRMIVASFLTKDLVINWQWGEKYFMQTLIDGDLSANNGGWQWSASSGMDPKPLRIFNPASQAQKFDPDAQYIRQWLPELRRLETKELVTGIIAPEDCRACHYPKPIVDHKVQQNHFKSLYKANSRLDTKS